MPLILNLGTRWGEWSASRLGRFIPGKERGCPFSRMLGWMWTPWTWKILEIRFEGISAVQVIQGHFTDLQERSAL